MLRQMFPSAATDNCGHSWPTHAVTVGNGAMSFAIQSTPADVHNICIGQRRSMMSDTAVSMCRVAASFGPRISNIVTMRPEKQMLWVDARRIVATVTDFHALRDGTVTEYPREAMGEDSSALMRREAITSFSFAGHPQPARRSFVDVRQERRFIQDADIRAVRASLTAIFPRLVSPRGASSEKNRLAERARRRERRLEGHNASITQG